MPTLYLSTAAANAAADAVVDRCDAGAGPATLKVYSGALPADGDTDPPGTLLATVVLADPAFGGAAGGIAAASDPDAVSIVATGTAAVGAIEDSNGNNVITFDVGATGSGAVLELATTALSAGASLDITAFNYTQPDGT